MFYFPPHKVINFLVASFCLLLTIPPAYGQASDAVPFSLHAEGAGFSPAAFFIAGLTDDRNYKQAIFVNGFLSTLNKFIADNLPSDRSLRPVIIGIKQLGIKEDQPTNGTVNGHIKLSLAFELQRQFDTVLLVNYNSAAAYTRPVIRTYDVEPTVRHLLLGALSWFNAWFNKQADRNPLLAKGVLLTFSDYTEKPEGDTIYYSAQRRLTWDDFKGRVNRSAFSAEVFTSIGYTEKVEVVNGIIHVSLAMKTYLPKSAAWAKNTALDEWELNHEQRHFDITKIITERFKRKMAAEKLSADNYDGPINVEYLEVLRQLYAMQTQYDKETSHGTNYAAQEDWNRRIDKELQSFGIEKS